MSSVPLNETLRTAALALVAAVLVEYVVTTTPLSGIPAEPAVTRPVAMAVVSV